MSIEIIGPVDKDRIFCAGSFTKLMTTYVSLSLLAEKYVLDDIVDDDNFLDSICVNAESREFLTLFQNYIGGKFSIHDLCSYYSGLSYTFDVSQAELESVDAGHPFKHNSIMEEKTFLSMCHHDITAIYADRCKFHYSELAIVFLGYLMEKAFSLKMEDLFHKYVIDKFKLKSTQFSRTRVPGVFVQDLSDVYDYPSIAIADHGYFCYSNGYYTTLTDMKTLLENMLEQPVFKCMTDIKKARAASPRLMNGLTIELRLVGDDVIYGYEGLSFSGCNLWAYSTKHKKGYVTFNNSEEDIYPEVYDKLGYTDFDKVPDYTQTLYRDFLKRYDFDVPQKDIPTEYQGNYHRVRINEKDLDLIFIVGDKFIQIRDPEEIRYDITYRDELYWIKGKDGVHGERVCFYQVKSGNRYMFYDGTLYRKL